jgi:anti-sigma B factor antagonist
VSTLGWRRGRMKKFVGLHLDAVVVGRTRIVRVAGELDMATGPQLNEEMSRLIEADEDKQIVLDLAELRFLDCAGIGHLTELVQRAASRAISLRICNAAGTVEEVLRLTGMEDILHMPPLGAASAPRNWWGDTAHGAQSGSPGESIMGEEGEMS